MFLTFETFSSVCFCNQFEASMNILWDPDFKTSNLSFNVLLKYVYKKEECIYFVAPIPYNKTVIMWSEKDSGSKY